MKKGGRKKTYLSLKGGERGGWYDFELCDTQKREIRKGLEKAGISAEPIAKFNRLFAGIEAIVNRKRSIDKKDHEERLTPKEIKQEIARLQDSIEHLQKNLLLLYEDDLHQSVEASLEAALYLDFKMTKPSLFIHRLREDLETLNVALQRAGEDFKIQMGRPDFPKGTKTFIAHTLARIYRDALTVMPTCTASNSDAQTEDSPFVLLLRKTYELCDLGMADVKRYASEAVRGLKKNP